jgi:hypothetical protein
VTKIRSIELSGVGFFANLEVPPDAPRATPPNITGGDARIDLSGVEHGAGCLLFVRNGHLNMLEAYTFDEDWPEPVHDSWNRERDSDPARMTSSRGCPTWHCS